MGIFRKCLISTQRVFSVPLRLGISILLLMTGGLLAMYGSAILAQLMYGVVLPAITSGDDPSTDASRLGISRNGVLFITIFGAIMIVELTIMMISVASTIFSYVGMASWFREHWTTLLNYDPRLVHLPKHIPRRLKRLNNESKKDMTELSSKLEVLGVSSKGAATSRGNSNSFAASINYMGLGTSQFVQVSQALDFCEYLFLCLFVCSVLVGFVMCFIWAPDIVAHSDDFSPPSSVTNEMYNQPPSISFDTYARAFVMIFVVITNFVLFFGLVFLIFYRAIWGLVRAVSGWCKRASNMKIFGFKRFVLFVLFLTLTPAVFMIAPIPLLLYRSFGRIKVLFKRHCSRTQPSGAMGGTGQHPDIDVSTPVDTDAVHVTMHNTTSSNTTSSNTTTGTTYQRVSRRVRGVFHSCKDACVTVSRAYIHSMPLPDDSDTPGDWKHVSFWTFLLFDASFNAHVLPALRCICFPGTNRTRKYTASAGEVVHNPTATHHAHSASDLSQSAITISSPTSDTGAGTGLGSESLEVYKKEMKPVDKSMKSGFFFILHLVLGVGDSSWDNFCAFLTHTNAWYLSLWFLGSLIHVTAFPQVCVSLGILSLPALAVGIYNTVYQRRKSNDVLRENLWLRHLYASSPNKLQRPSQLNKEKYILKNLKVGVNAKGAQQNNVELVPVPSNSPPSPPSHTPPTDPVVSPGTVLPLIRFNPLVNGPEPPAPDTTPDTTPLSSRSAQSSLDRSTGGTGIDTGNTALPRQYVNPINAASLQSDVLRGSDRRQRSEFLKSRASQRAITTPATAHVDERADADMDMEGAQWEGAFLSAESADAKLEFIRRDEFNPETVVEDTSVPCAWGALVLGLCIVATLMSWTISITMGISMSMTLLFIIGNACMRRPSSNFASSTCRLILVLVAALYGVMTSAMGESPAKGSLFAIGPDWTGIPTNPFERIEPFYPPNVFNAQSNVYGACGARMNSLTPLDMCYMSASVYNDRNLGNADVLRWFQEEGRNLMPIPLPPSKTGVTIAAYYEDDDTFHPHVRSMHDLSTWGSKSRIYISIRGTSVARDVSQDALIWQESLFFKLLSTIGPFSSWPISAIQAFIGLIGSVKYQYRGPWGNLSYADEAVTIIKDLQKLYPSSSFIVTGHSLGGGLSTIVGQKLDIPFVSFSGPGALFSAIKLGISNTKGMGLVFIPAYDIVPLIDVHTSNTQHLQCLNAASALSCHSITRTCCELRRACGDIGGFNRTLSSCAKYV